MNRRILHLAVPNIISNLTVPLLSMVDMAVLGHLESERYIGAIAVGGVLFSVVYWPFTFLRASSSGFASQGYGARRLDQCANVLLRSLLLGLSIGLLLVLLQWVIAWLGFSFLSGSAAVLDLARSYFHVRIWDAPATIGLYAISGWMLGMQNARSPMLVAIVVNVLNIGFNLLFVLGFGWKVVGVALGSVLAQWLGLALALWLLWRYYAKVLQRARWAVALQWKAVGAFGRVNGDIFLRMLCVIAVISFFTNSSAATDDTTLAVNTLLIQFFYLFSYFADGFAYAAEALVGKYIGQGDGAYLRRAVRASFVWGMGIAVATSLFYAGSGRWLLWLLTNNEGVLHAAQHYWPWVAALPVLSFASFIWDGVYIGATASRAMRNTMLVSALLFFPVYYLTVPSLHNHALWLALLTFLFSRGLLQTWLAPKVVFGRVGHWREQ